MSLGNRAKRFISFLLTFILIVCTAAGPVSVKAAGTVSFAVSSTTAVAGTDVVVSINISANSSMAAATLLLKYDNTKLTYKSFATGPAASEGMSSVNQVYKTEGSYTTISDCFISDSAITSGGSMLNVVFAIKSGWTGSTPLNLTVSEIVDSGFNALTTSITNGSVTVTPPVAPTLSATPTNGNVTVTISYPAGADVKEFKIGTGDWTAYSAPIVLNQNNTVYARYFDTFSNASDTGSIVVSNIGSYVNIKENDSRDDGVIYQKVKLFGFYRNKSLLLDFETDLTNAAVKWESSNIKKVLIGATTGLITNKGISARAADITVTLTKGAEVVSDTVRVIFYKYDWQLDGLSR